MSIANRIDVDVTANTRRVSGVLLTFFSISIFLSAGLLFTLEPLFTKMALPLLGGAPAVWSVAMVFFQTVMMAGYAYAHFLTKFLSVRRAACVHSAILLLSIVFMPIKLRMGDNPPAEGDPTWWLIRCLALSIGLPFFALASQGPLLQAWFARSKHEKAHDPYFLYAASNIGSLAALLAYPFIIEPAIGLKAQSAAFAYAFVIGAVAVFASAIAAIRHGDDDPEGMKTSATHADWKIDTATIARWLAWSFIPSALLVSVTTHISTDVAAAPLLWVIPLGLYLVSFIASFRKRPLFGTTFGQMLGPLGATIALISIGLPSGNLYVGTMMHLVAFFCVAFVSGRSLFETRPDARKLTSFYAIMSFGGALGGIFSGLIAPQVFNSIIEYPILLLGALLAGSSSGTRSSSGLDREKYIPIIIMCSCLAIGHAILHHAGDAIAASRVAFAGVGIVMLLKWRDPRLVNFGGSLLVIQLTCLPPLGEAGESIRSFFGVSKIIESRSGEFRALVHGTTMHGAMRIRDVNGNLAMGRPEPTTYYHRSGPLASALRAARVQNGGLAQVTVIGLGAGAMACHIHDGESVTFYEIDPTVVRVATDPRHFRFLSECTPDAKIVLGDARLTLAQQRETSDFILVDAFSSDAIPVHLLTLESLRLYMSKLSPHGMITFHTSNNHMDFAELIGRLALELGLHAYENRDLAVKENEDLRMAATAVSVVREPQDAEGLFSEKEGWHKIVVRSDAVLWTDDFSSILFPLAAKLQR